MTKQTGPAGKPVNTLYIASKLDLAKEMYFAILLDRKSAGTMIIACGEGEYLATKKWRLGPVSPCHFCWTSSLQNGGGLSTPEAVLQPVQIHNARGDPAARLQCAVKSSGSFSSGVVSEISFTLLKISKDCGVD